MLEHCIWTLYIPATRQDFDAALLEYQELPPIGPAELWPEWELEQGNGEYMALSAGRMEDWDNMESLGEFFSRKFKGPVYALGAPGEFVFERGKRKKFTLHEETEYEFSVRLGCPVEYRRPILKPRTLFKAHIVLKVTKDQWDAALEKLEIDRGVKFIQPHHRFVEVPTGMLCYCAYTHDENGVIFKNDKEEPFPANTARSMFKKATLARIFRDKEHDSFVYTEDKWFEVQCEYVINAKPDDDPDVIRLTNVQGETEPVAILKKLGVPLEALGYEEV